MTTVAAADDARDGDEKSESALLAPFVAWPLPATLISPAVPFYLMSPETSSLIPISTAVPLPPVASPLEPSVETMANHTPPVQPPSPDKCVKRDDEGRFIGWMDFEQCVASNRSLAAARWFDDLFGSWQEEDSSRVLIKAITEVTVTEGQGATTNFYVRASAVLPNMKKRLRLIIEDDRDRSLNTAGLDTGPSQNKNSGRASAALRWNTFNFAGFKSTIDLGAHGVNPPDVFVRTRTRNDWSLSTDAIMRFGQTFIYGSHTRGRSISQVDLEDALNNKIVARFSNAYAYDQRATLNGFNWTHGVSLAYALGNRRSVSYGFTVNGHTAPDWRGQSYGPWIGYRSSFLRSWLIYEVVPQLTWSRPIACCSDQHWNRALSLVMRLEIQLGRK
jgi:hypothetical protein